MKRALITGITGQDGSYLAEYLLDRNYEVHGLIRPGAGDASDPSFWRIQKVRDRLHLHAGNVEETRDLKGLIQSIRCACCAQKPSLSVTDCLYMTSYCSAVMSARAAVAAGTS